MEVHEQVPELAGCGTAAPADGTVTGRVEVTRRGRRPAHRWARLRAVADDAGMATAEYAIATVAAAGFAGLLVLVLRSPEVREALSGLVSQALSV